LKLSESLIKQRLELFRLRKPTSVLKNIWVLPVFMGIILLMTQGYRTITNLLIVLTCIYILCSIIAYYSWKNGLSDRGTKKRRNLYIVMIYDGILLSSFSILFFVAANMSFQWIDPLLITTAGMYSSILYLFIVIFILISGKSIVKHLINNQNKPLAPQTRVALSIPSALVGAGVVLGTILRTSQFGVILAIGLGYLCAYLLLPFAITIFFQVYILIREI